MAINYTRVNWNTSKFVNPTNMNQMDAGIKAACDNVDEIYDYKAGDYVNLSYKPIMGNVTADRKGVRFAVPIVKKTGSLGKTFTGNFSIMGIGGLIVDNQDISGYTVTLSSATPEMLAFLLAKTDGTVFSGATASTPAIVYFYSGARLTFS